MNRKDKARMTIGITKRIVTKSLEKHMYGSAVRAVIHAAARLSYLALTYAHNKAWEPARKVGDLAAKYGNRPRSYDRNKK